MSDPRPVQRFLEDSADRDPDAVVIEDGRRCLRYAELEAAANRIAARLVERGVLRGDRVALLAENGFEYVAGFFGILKAGGCCVSLNGANKLRSNVALLQDCGAVALVTCAPQVRADLPALAEAAPALHTIISDRTDPGWNLPDRVRLLDAAEVAAASDARVDAGTEPGDRCAIIYTSGSTGHPRGVTLSHRNLATNTRQILDYLPITAEDSVLCVLPFHYSYGKSLLLTHVARGGRVVVDNHFAYPARVVDHLEHSRATSFAGVPSTFAILAARTDFLARDWPHLRYLTEAGGALSVALQRRFRETLPERIRIYIMYGQTEAGPRLSWLPPERLPEKYGSIGVAIPGVELTLRRPDGSECETGEVGEVVARGENIMEGYWNDPEETAKVLFADGLHTGDLGRRDAEGFIWLVDRVKNMIKVGANRVSAREVEETVAELPGVQEVCVIGVADELLGEAIEAFVVPAPGAELSAPQVQRHCRERLAFYKVPRKVHLRVSLPRSSAGKILKNQLR